MNKRYITLAPVANLMGIAFNLEDPDNLIGKSGITVAIVKRNKNKKQIFFRYMASSLDGKKIIKSKTFFDLNNYKKQSFKLGSKIKELI